MSTTIQAFLCRVGYTFTRHPLGNLILAISFIFLFFLLLHLPENYGQYDGYISAYVGIMSFFVALTIILKTRFESWTALNAGLFGIFFGLFIVFIKRAYIHAYGTFEYEALIIVMARSIIIPSTTWILVGLFLEWWYGCNMSFDRFKKALRHPLRFYRKNKKELPSKGI